MSQPVVAIVGRPNVGKSTLFNRIIQKRIAIEEKISGITRDRIYGRAEWQNNNFILVDTGGISFDKTDPLAELVRKQARLAIEQASIIVMVLDSRIGLTHLDIEIADMLKRTKKAVVLAGNKGEGRRSDQYKYDLYALGLGEPVIISAVHGLNIGDLLDRIVDLLPETEENFFQGVKVAIIGKPNVGKSSLVNYLAKEERAIVSDLPGTTRDAIDTLITIEDKNYLLVDTAGLKQKGKIKDNVGYYSMLRALKAIEDADVVIAVIDSLEGITEQDKRILGYADTAGKALIIAFNKWDAMENREYMARKLKVTAEQDLAFVRYAPITFISAKTGQRVTPMFSLVEKVYQEYNKRISTGLLNSFLQDVLVSTPPPAMKGKTLKIYYITQFKVGPPKFSVFVNNKKLLHFSYVRHLENKLRQAFGFHGTPIRILVREKKERTER